MERINSPELLYNSTVETTKNRRRRRTVAQSGGETIVSRADRLIKRNRILTARYYYWTELKRRRFDDVLKILSDNEFFVEERTIGNALIEQDEFYKDMIRQRMTRSQLRRIFPGFDWR